MKRFRRLLFLPLLLLVPLGVLKWRLERINWIQDHPPVSKMDRQFVATLNSVNSVFIYGQTPVWGQVTHLPQQQMIVVADRKLLTQLKQTFRLSDEPGTQPAPAPRADFVVWIPGSTTQTDVAFCYYRNWKGKGNYVIYADKGATLVKMPSRFGPRFEALVGQMVQRAKAKGNHPEIVLRTQGY